MFPSPEVNLTNSSVLWEAEQGQVSIVTVGPIVVEIWSKICLCCRQTHKSEKRIFECHRFIWHNLWKKKLCSLNWVEVIKHNLNLWLNQLVSLLSVLYTYYWYEFVILTGSLSINAKMAEKMLCKLYTQSPLSFHLGLKVHYINLLRYSFYT